jgi:uncharacterized RDD family membrane protein YckC
MALTKTAVVPLYAGFWRRGAAALIDSLILLVPNVAVSYAFPDQSGWAFLATIALACAYFAGLHAAPRQATLGKMMFGIKVTGLDGERISLARAIGRYFATWISTILLCIGWLIAAFTRKKQALHDMIAGTLVVNDQAEPEEVVAGGDTMPVTGGVWAVAVLLLLFPFVAGILAAIAIPTFQDYLVRSRVHEALESITPLRDEIGKTLEKRQALTGGAIGLSSRHFQSIEVSERGEIATRFVPTVAGGGKVIYTPIIDSSGKVSWKCTSPEVAPKYLPPACRG